MRPSQNAANEHSARIEKDQIAYIKFHLKSKYNALNVCMKNSCPKYTLALQQFNAQKSILDM